MSYLSSHQKRWTNILNSSHISPLQEAFPDLSLSQHFAHLFIILLIVLYYSYLFYVFMFYLLTDEPIEDGTIS